MINPSAIMNKLIVTFINLLDKCGSLLCTHLDGEDSCKSPLHHGKCSNAPQVKLGVWSNYPQILLAKQNTVPQNILTARYFRVINMSSDEVTNGYMS